MRNHFHQTLEWFVEAVFASVPIELRPSATWSDDAWFVDQDHRELLANDGWWKLQPGAATGRVVGGNLCTLNLLQGTPFMPPLETSLLMVEDDFETNPAEFARDLTSLLQLPAAAGVCGLVVGRFQPASGISRPILEQIIQRQPALVGRPVLANVDFGHTSPMATIPIGGQASLAVDDATTTLTLDKH